MPLTASPACSNADDIRQVRLVNYKTLTLPNAPAYVHLLLPRSIVTPRGNIAAVCFRPESQDS
jgi:hypothetical protein